MGQTRNFLNKINGLIYTHDIEKRALIKKYCENPDLEKFYRHQIDAFDQKLEKRLRKMIDEHIIYLEQKDPYGREPLWGAEVKKQLFVKTRQNIDSCAGQRFIQVLSREVEGLLQNPIIDQPRWPKLKLDNMYHFFKSLVSNKSAYLDNTKKPEPKPKSHKHKI